MDMPVFEWRSTIPVRLAELYAWHTRGSAYDRLLPPWLHLKVLERPAEIADGARLAVRYRGAPLPGHWTATFAGVLAERQIVLRQTRGPFAIWEHTISFTSLEAERSEVLDRVEYTRSTGRLTTLPGETSLRARLEPVMRFRHARTRDDLVRHAAWQASPRLKVAVSGASGFIGTSLVAYLQSAGHDVVRLVRRPAAGHDEIEWNPAAGHLDPAQLEGVDAVVNLAGASIASVWTAARRQAILASRVQATQTLAAAIAGLPSPPKVLISASAVGAYGSRGSEDISETSALGDGFLAHVCREWEAAALPAGEAGVRVVNPRFGLVMSTVGGSLAKMLPAFRAGLGGRLGDGRQWWSWVSLDDLLGALEWLLHDEQLSGPVNITAPYPLTNAEFTKALARVLRRPAALAAPRGVLTGLLRGMADEMLLASQRVLPSRLSTQGFRFIHPTLEPALRFELGRQEAEPGH
jgi:uncharacterized protein